MAIKAHLDPPISDAPASDDLQRAEPRRALRLDTSGFAADGEEANVTIHNVSAAGLLIETALDLAEGERFALDLPEAGTVAAVIVWHSQQLYGCAFEQALGPAALAAVQLQGFAPQGPAVPGFISNKVVSAEALGTRLNRLRREAGLTLADVAAVLGVSKPTVWAWEKGKARPLPERLGAIAAALGVPVDVLVEAPGAVGAVGAVVEECRTRIAEACGTNPINVKIMIEM